MTRAARNFLVAASKKAQPAVVQGLLKQKEAPQPEVSGQTVQAVGLPLLRHLSRDRLSAAAIPVVHPLVAADQVLEEVPAEVVEVPRQIWVNISILPNLLTKL